MKQHYHHVLSPLLGKPPLPNKTLKNNTENTVRWGHADKISLFKNRLP